MFFMSNLLTDQIMVPKKGVFSESPISIHHFPEKCNPKVFPFEIRKAPAHPYAAMSEEEILRKLERSREHARQGMYRDADDVIADMRAKYGL